MIEYEYEPVRPPDRGIVDFIRKQFYEPLEAEVHRQLTDCHCESNAPVYTNAEFLKHIGLGPKLEKDFAEYGSYCVMAKCDDCGDCEPVWIHADLIWKLPQMNKELFDWIARDQMKLGCMHMMQHTVISTPYTSYYEYWYGERHAICLECGAEIILELRNREVDMIHDIPRID